MRNRNNEAEAVDAATPEEDKRGRRTGRGLGPFSGGQLTIIIVAIVVMVMLPIGAFAVSGSNAFITDAGTGKQAKVSTAGNLAVGSTTVVISTGTLTVDPLTSKALFANQNVSAYKQVRLSVKQSPASPSSQSISVIGTPPLILLDNFTMTSNYFSATFDTPGMAMSLLVVNGSPSVAATYTWNLVGRTN